MAKWYDPWGSSGLEARHGGGRRVLYNWPRGKPIILDDSGDLGPAGLRAVMESQEPQTEPALGINPATTMSRGNPILAANAIAQAMSGLGAAPVTAGQPELDRAQGDENIGAMSPPTLPIRHVDRGPMDDYLNLLGERAAPGGSQIDAAMEQAGPEDVAAIRTANPMLTTQGGASPEIDAMIEAQRALQSRRGAFGTVRPGYANIGAEERPLAGAESGQRIAEKIFGKSEPVGQGYGELTNQELLRVNATPETKRQMREDAKQRVYERAVALQRQGVLNKNMEPLDAMEAKQREARHERLASEEQRRRRGWTVRNPEKASALQMGEMLSRAMASGDLNNELVRGVLGLPNLDPGDKLRADTQLKVAELQAGVNRDELTRQDQKSWDDRYATLRAGGMEQEEIIAELGQRPGSAAPQSRPDGVETGRMVRELKNAPSKADVLNRNMGEILAMARTDPEGAKALLARSGVTEADIHDQLSGVQFPTRSFLRYKELAELLYPNVKKEVGSEAARTLKRALLGSTAADLLQ